MGGASLDGERGAAAADVDLTLAAPNGAFVLRPATAAAGDGAGTLITIESVGCGVLKAGGSGDAGSSGEVGPVAAAFSRSGRLPYASRIRLSLRIKRHKK